MYCPKCGTELPEGSKFCPKCGESVELSKGFSQSEPSKSIKQTVMLPDPQPPQVSDEEVRCPRCGSKGCTPHYKQNISGGGYGCLQGGLGAIILGPFGLLCGLCGRSAKTTNTLMWVCPKCGHEFLSRKDMYANALILLWIGYSLVALLAFFTGGAIATGIAGYFWIFLILLGPCIAFIIWVPLKDFENYTTQEKAQLKRHAIVAGIVAFVAFLVPFVLVNG